MDQAEDRLRQYGPNDIARERPQSPLRRLLDNLKNPLVLLLVPGDIVQLAAGDMVPADVRLLVAKGALAMARKQVIVKRLNAIQNFGAMDVLCTDKTGTLTQGRIVLEQYLDAESWRTT